MNSITIKKSPSPTQEQKDLKAFIHAKEFIPSQQKSFNFNSNINNNLNYNSSPQGIIPIDNSAYSNQYYNEIPYWMNEDNEGNDMYEKMAQLDKKERYQSNNKSIDYDNLLTGWEPMSEGYNNIKQDKNNDKFQYNNIDNNINNNIDFENLSNEWDPVSEVYDSRKQIKRENKSIYDKNNLLGYDKEKGMKQKNNKKEDWINNLLDDKTNEMNKNIFNTNEQEKEKDIKQEDNNSKKSNWKDYYLEDKYKELKLKYNLDFKLTNNKGLELNNNNNNNDITNIDKEKTVLKEIKKKTTLLTEAVENISINKKEEIKKRGEIETTTNNNSPKKEEKESKVRIIYPIKRENNKVNNNSKEVLISTNYDIFPLTKIHRSGVAYGLLLDLSNINQQSTMQNNNNQQSIESIIIQTINNTFQHISCLEYRSKTKLEIGFYNNKDRERALNTPLTINNHSIDKVKTYHFDDPIIGITITNLPCDYVGEVVESQVNKFLSKYGNIVYCKHLKYTNTNIYMRLVAAAIIPFEGVDKEDIDRCFKLNNFTVFCHPEGAAERCFKCNSEEHKSNQCEVVN